MASQAIKEYDDFAGQDGYVIVDGLDDQTPGGKKLLSSIGSSSGAMTYEERTLDKSIIEGGIVPYQHVNNNSITKIQFDSRVTSSDLPSGDEYLVITVCIDKTSPSEATNCVIEIPGQDVKVRVKMYNYYGPENDQVIGWVTPHFVTISGSDHPEYFDKDKYIQVRILGNVADGYTHDDIVPDPGSGS